MSIIQYKNFAYLKGPKGDKGPQGLKGDRGPKGDKGDPGARGPEGPATPASAIRSLISGSNPITFDPATGVISFNATGFATETYVNNAISNLIGGAPELLNTLNEIAAAIGNNANFIDNVVLKSGTTMTGPLTLNSDPTSELHAATKRYVDDAISSIPMTTDDVVEGATNLYFTNSRARSAISVTGAGSYDTSTGVITVTGGVTSVNGQAGAVDLNLLDLGISDGSTGQYLTTDGAGNFSFVSSEWDGAVFDGGDFDGTEIMPAELAIDGGLLETYYSPVVPSDWSGSAPTSVHEALDRIAAVLKTLNGGVGA